MVKDICWHGLFLKESRKNAAFDELNVIDYKIILKYCINYLRFNHISTALSFKFFPFTTKN